MHLVSMGLVHTIASENATTSEDRGKTIIFIRHHLDIPLPSEYLTVKDPLDLWNELREIFEHFKYITLPKARHDWLNLRLQDFKTVIEYNSVIHQITSQLILYGKIVTENDKLEKTLSTFHASNVVLQQQYREKTFKSKPQYGDIAEKAKQGKRQIDICNRCGNEGNWANTYRITKHLVDLYQASLQKKGKEVEINHVDNDDDPDDDLLDYDTTHLDIADFVVDPANPQ
ncbi:uncharacterized protein LOC127257635 [Andrographis paniculata]|uniref:uncharacterized protein LOC127257635 n=1 Tax=Andrographis paniculata TaxID=175694 RepID=UPI0021E8CD7D|nr:uncharacterized protein LOC127257635 [Andrographis paniculata]